MIRKKNELKTSEFEKRLGGEGILKIKSLAETPEELNNKGTLFAHNTLGPGCSIGYHIHNGNSEIYYLLRGTGEFNDNGKVCTVEAGDVTLTKSGEGHSLANTGNEPMEFIALILNC